MSTSSPSPSPTNPEPNRAQDAGVLFGCTSFVLLVVAASIGLGLHLLGPSQETIRLARESPDWPRAPGRVTSARVHFHDGGSSGHSRFEPQMTYTYEVEGAVHEGTRIRFGELDFGSFWARARARAVLEPYEGLPAVEVFVHPGDPSVSVLEPGVSMATFSEATNALLLFLIGVAGIALLLWLFQDGFRRRGPSRPPAPGRPEPS